MPNFVMQVEDKHLVVEAEFLPPIGAIVHADKHLSRNGASNVRLEVTAHEWRLEQAGPGENPTLSLTAKTRSLQ